jgi:hypothetical protein
VDSGSPSEYPTNEDLENRAASGDPVARTTLSGRGRQIVTGGLAATPDVTPTAPRGRRVSAFILRLAVRLSASPDELAKRYSDDTIRRTKYPVIEEELPDGTIKYKEIKVK